MTRPSYERWRKRLAGEKVEAFVNPEPADVGFYRKPIKVKKPNGQWKTTGYQPVALFVDGNNGLSALVGDNMVAGPAINDLWQWIVQHPISEETYRAVAEKGEPWPDFTPEAEPADDNMKMTEVEKIRARLVLAEGDLPKFAKIETDEQASRARSLQQRFLDIRGDCGKAYEAGNRPLLDQQKKLRETWFPLRDAADEASIVLRKAMGAHEDHKREAAKRAAEEQRKRDEQHRLEVEKAREADLPAPAAPAPVIPNTPPPSTQIKAAGVKAASVTVKKVVTAINVATVIDQFVTTPEVYEVLMKLAQKAVNAGIDVPGATIEERADIR